MKTVSITLEEPIDLPSGKITAVVVREPRAGDIIDVGGDPSLLARTETGVVISVESDDKIRGYLERLVQTETGSPLSMALLRTASVVDYMRIRDAVLDFFGKARERAWKIDSGSSS
ncbi:MAG: DUF810 domain-containing protein [Proteobacteria bacterium]|nr:DUF810 domain-containing protein [Pseudomonadota bacterium]